MPFDMPPAPPAIVMPAQATTTERNAALVRQGFADWAAGKGAIFDLLAPDFVWTIEGSSPSAGTYNRQSFDPLLAPFNAALAAPLVPTLTTLVADGDQVAVRFTATAPLKAGGTYRNSYAWFMTVRDGKITHVTAFLDLAAFDAVREGDVKRAR